MRTSKVLFFCVWRTLFVSSVQDFQKLKSLENGTAFEGLDIQK